MAQVVIPKECGVESYIQVQKDKTVVLCIRHVIHDGRPAIETKKIEFHCATALEGK